MEVCSSENQKWLIQLGVRSSFWLIQSHIVCLLCWSSAVSLCLTDMMYGYSCSSFLSIRNTLEEDILNSCDRQRWDFFGLLMVEFRILSIFSWILVTLAGRPLFPLLVFIGVDFLLDQANSRGARIFLLRFCFNFSGNRFFIISVVITFNFAIVAVKCSRLLNVASLYALSQV